MSDTTPTLPKKMKRRVVTIDVSAVGDDAIAQREAAGKALLAGVREDRAKIEARHAANLKLIEDVAKGKLYATYFSTVSVPKGEKPVVIDAIKAANARIRKLRVEFSETLTSGQTGAGIEAVRILIRALEEQGEDVSEFKGRGVTGSSQRGGQESDQGGMSHERRAAEGR